MPTRIVIGGRTVAASPNYQPRPLRFMPKRDLEVLADPRVRAEEAPYREGLPFFDAEDGVEYRSVGAATLDPRGGWRTAEFWIERWSIDWSTLRRFKDLGMIDAAIERGGALKRFRCRDERKVLAWLEEKQKERTRAKLAKAEALSPRISRGSSSGARSARSR